MYLKSIKAHGFKSFADNIFIELDDKITGIVGPNGSGKSNIVDAVRWVLGEQSVKSLRGDGNMTDVIFSGSKSRNPSQVATVTLTFDNKDKTLPLDFNEVAIKRRLYKDGTNEFFINNERVRLKDVINLLLDSGIAKESFNIISQGKIEEILSNKPDERRIIFEEASGVLKYKKRKEEALRKLDKTHSNMDRINDIITELELRVEPLKQEKEKALQYNELSIDLENIEVSLIASDITNYNNQYQQEKNEIKILKQEIENLSVNNSVDESKILEYKKNINLLDNKIKENQVKLIELTKQVEQVNSRKAIILERQKYKVSDSKIHENLIRLKEQELEYKTKYKKITDENNQLKDELKIILNKIEICNQENKTIKSNKNDLVVRQNHLVKNITSIKYKIENLINQIESNGSLPFSVKKVLENPKLNGINDIIGNIFNVSDQYSLAISTILGISAYNIVVDCEENAKEAINYLKTNNLGRATFYPLNIIKGKIIDEHVLDDIKTKPGFIDIAVNLINYEPKYQYIMLNLLGNVIVVDTITNANLIAKLVNYKYRIVTLDGQLLHVGGSLSGGSANKTKNIISDKYELSKLQNEYKIVNQNIEVIESEIKNIDNQLNANEDKLNIQIKAKLNQEVLLDNNNKILSELQNKLDNISTEILGNNNIIDNKLDSEEQEVLKQYYETLELKNKTETSLKQLQNHRDDLNNELSDYELIAKKESGLFNSKKAKLNELEISVNRLDVKLDNLLTTLSEDYSLTYEAAISRYVLEIDELTARNKVSQLKKQIKDLGNVNLNSIEEFDKVNERYEFLNNQRNDLTKAENTLLEIINEMDKVMERDFLNTFKVIKEKFNETFKELFKGGSADLKLTDPGNVLETGIEINACPPGKKLTTISLLSGGEKTFTAISLLFAILKSKPVPFCILDEVEAALDDVNVDSFGKYISNLKDKTQFIIITHKKKTMEYVDSLYGITMQESGVSNLVSVKLEEIK